MSIKIFTMTHKKFEVPKDKMYTPLQVGRAVSKDLGYIGDDTGDNISDFNCYYSELTGIYWVWKNYHDSDYVGVCHYRRYLISEDGYVFNKSQYEELLKTYDLVTTKKVELNFSYYYGFGENHNIKALEETGKVISEMYPEYYDVFNKLVHSNKTYFGNIMVTTKKLFDDYCKWLFNIFFEVQKRVDLSSPDDYHRRVFGFISEFLLLVWVTKNQLKAYECRVGMLGEKAETRELKEQLAAYFKKNDITGAKEYFNNCLKKRPDVLMEASDITGELKLSMQVISTADFEQKIYGKSILNYISDFRELMNYFNKINGIVNNYIHQLDREKESDIAWIHDKKVSDISIEIAVMILSESKETSVNTLLSIASDLIKSGDNSVAAGLIKRSLDYMPNNNKAIKLLNEISINI